MTRDPRKTKCECGVRWVVDRSCAREKSISRWEDDDDQRGGKKISRLDDRKKGVFNFRVCGCVCVWLWLWLWLCVCVCVCVAVCTATGRLQTVRTAQHGIREGWMDPTDEIYDFDGRRKKSWFLATRKKRRGRKNSHLHSHGKKIVT